MNWSHWKMIIEGKFHAMGCDQRFIGFASKLYQAIGGELHNDFHLPMSQSTFITAR